MLPPARPSGFPLSRDGQELLVAQHCAALSRRANGLRVTSILVGLVLLAGAMLLADRVQTRSITAEPSPVQIVGLLGIVLLVVLVPHALLAQAVGADRAWAELLRRGGLAVEPDGFGHPVLTSTRSRPWFSLSTPVLLSDYLLTVLSPLTFAVGLTATLSLARLPLGWPVVSFLTIAVAVMLASWLNLLWLIHQCHARVSVAAHVEPDEAAPPVPAPAKGAAWGRRAGDHVPSPPVPDPRAESSHRLIESLFAQQPWPMAPDPPDAAPASASEPVPPPVPEPSTPPPAAGPPLPRAPQAPGKGYTLTRESLPGGVEVVRGTCSVVIPAGGDLAVQYIGFIPALPAAPAIRCEALNGQPVTIHVAKALAYGARIEIRPHSPLPTDTETSFRFEAVCAE